MTELEAWRECGLCTAPRGRESIPENPGGRQEESGRMPRSALSWPGGGRRRRRLAAGQAQPSAQGRGSDAAGRASDPDEIAVALEPAEARFELGDGLGPREVLLDAALACRLEEALHPAPQARHGGLDRDRSERPRLPFDLGQVDTPGIPRRGYFALQHFRRRIARGRRFGGFDLGFRTRPDDAVA